MDTYPKWVSSYKECNFIICYERIKMFSKIIEQILYNSKRIPEALFEVTSQIAEIGQNYRLLTLCVPNADITMDTNNISEINAMVAPNSSVFEFQYAAHNFQEDVKRVKEGKAFLEYSKGVTSITLIRLQKVSAMATNACKIGKKVATLLKKVGKLKHDVTRKETKYSRLRKPLSESKRYSKQYNKMQQAEKAFQENRNLFDQHYTEVMQNQLFISGQVLNEFFGDTLRFLMKLVQPFGLIVPTTTETLKDTLEHCHLQNQEMRQAMQEAQQTGGSAGAAAANGDGKKNLSEAVSGLRSRGGILAYAEPPPPPSLNHVSGYRDGYRDGLDQEPSTPPTVRMSERPEESAAARVGLARRSLDIHAQSSFASFSPPAKSTTGMDGGARDSRSPMPASVILRRLYPACSTSAGREPFEAVDDSTGMPGEGGRYSLTSAAETTVAEQPHPPVAVSAPPDESISMVSASVRQTS